MASNYDSVYAYIERFTFKGNFASNSGGAIAAGTSLTIVNSKFLGNQAGFVYNLNATKNFILQPNVFVSYNAFGKQNWHTGFCEMSMNSGMLNGINVAPGLNFIYRKQTWSVYATVQYMYNINDKISGSISGMDLPSIAMKHGYLQYGFGFTKSYKDKLHSYLQIAFRNGGRTGVGF